MDEIDMFPVTVEDALTAAKAAAFTVGDEWERAGETILHVFSQHRIGCDWGIDAVVDLIEKLEARYWIHDVFRHDLAVITPEYDIWALDVPNPARS